MGLALGIAVIAAALLYGSYAALRSNDQTTGSSDQSSSTSQALSGGWDEENVRQVQAKLREGGFYAGEIDGAYSSDLAAALTRYQIRNGLPVTGQLDTDTSNALGAKPAVAGRASSREQSSETWRRLRAGKEQIFANARVASPPGAEETSGSGTGMPPLSAPAATAHMSSTNAKVAPEPEFNPEHVRDYVGAFVLAGLDPNVGSEADFFADRVEYVRRGHEGAGKHPERFTTLRFALAETQILAGRRYQS